MCPAGRSMTGFTVMLHRSPSSMPSRFNKVGPTFLDPGNAEAGGERFDTEMHIHDGPRPCLGGVERGRCDLQRPMLGLRRWIGIRGRRLILNRIAVAGVGSSSTVSGSSSGTAA